MYEVSRMIMEGQGKENENGPLSIAFAAYRLV